MVAVWGKMGGGVAREAGEERAAEEEGENYAKMVNIL